MTTLIDEIEHQFGFRVVRYADVTIDGGALDGVLTWLSRNTSQRYVWDMLGYPAARQGGRYRVFFESECDCALFILTWS